MTKHARVKARQLKSTRIRNGVVSPRGAARLFQLYIVVVALLGSWLFVSKGDGMVGLIFFLVTSIGGLLVQGPLMRWIATRGGKGP